MKKRTVLLVIMLATGIFAYSQSDQAAHTKNVVAAEFKHLADSLQNEVVVDLRTPDETKSGKIPGAIEIDFFGPEFEPVISRLDKSKTYLLYCASGGRSGETAELMEKLGFKRLYNLKGGFREWESSKLPVAR
jgi:phage shock protein E